MFRTIVSEILSDLVALLAPLLSPVNYSLLRLSWHRLQEHVFYILLFSWRFESLFHFCDRGHRFFPWDEVIMKLKQFDVFFDSKLRLHLFFFLLVFCWKAKMTNTSSTSRRSLHISRLETCEKAKQVSLR